MTHKKCKMIKTYRGRGSYDAGKTYMIEESLAKSLEADRACTILEEEKEEGETALAPSTPEKATRPRPTRRRRPSRT